MTFQSTCPARGTTASAYAQDKGHGFQSTCPARGTTPSVRAKPLSLVFQSTCPARGTTRCSLPGTYYQRQISIHVPREGHDLISSAIYANSSLFQSTCPARGTTAIPLSSVESWLFQSTCPARGTTKRIAPFSANIAISIHVPREGHDSACVAPVVRA